MMRSAIQTRAAVPLSLEGEGEGEGKGEGGSTGAVKAASQRVGYIDRLNPPPGPLPGREGGMVCLKTDASLPIVLREIHQSLHGGDECNRCC
jgi:hypothetical protein